MPLDYRIDWSENSDYEEDIIRSVKSLDNDDCTDNPNSKQELFQTHATTIDDSIDPFELHNDNAVEEQRDNNDCFGKEVPLIISTDNLHSIWYENAYLRSDERDNNIIQNCDEHGRK